MTKETWEKLYKKCDEKKEIGFDLDNIIPLLSNEDFCILIIFLKRFYDTKSKTSTTINELKSSLNIQKSRIYYLINILEANSMVKMVKKQNAKEYKLTSINPSYYDECLPYIEETLKEVKK